jgi:hypothetical protein
MNSPYTLTSEGLLATESARNPGHERRIIPQEELLRLHGAQVLENFGSQCLPAPEQRLALITLRLREIG